MSKAKKYLAYPKGKEKVKIVMDEFKAGTLESGKTHKKVTNQKQAVAIALSEQRKKEGMDMIKKTASKKTAAKKTAAKKAVGAKKKTTVKRVSAVKKKTTAKSAAKKKTVAKKKTSAVARKKTVRAKSK